MRNEHQISIITDCIDNIAEYPYMAIHRERFALARFVSDELNSYPKPKECKETPKELLGAYCYIATARYTVELALLGYMPYVNAFNIAGGCLESALSLLTDNKA